MPQYSSKLYVEIFLKVISLFLFFLISSLYKPRGVLPVANPKFEFGFFD